MLFLAPHARMRIYTHPSFYFKVLANALFGTASDPKEISKFEQLISRFMGSKFCLAMPMARTGIYYAVKATIKPGQKVILSPITIVNVVNMIICAGGVPVFADVETNTGNIDPDDLEKLIDDQTGAVLITHLHGLSCEMDRIVEICNKRNVPIIEDAAQAFSTRFKGKLVGSFGKIGIFSFGMYKIVNSFYGGMLITNDEQVAQKVSQEVNLLPPMTNKAFLKKVFSGLLTDLATSPLIFRNLTYWVFKYAYLWGVESVSKIVSVDADPTRFDTMPKHLLCRMIPIQASLAAPQLAELEKNNAKRIETAKKYYEALKNIPELILPPMRTDGSHTYTYYAVRCPDRLGLMRFAMENNRDLVLCHYHNTASLEIFKEFYRDCPIAQASANELVYLPTYPAYPDSEIEKTIAMVKSFYELKRSPNLVEEHSHSTVKV